jgi:hypothetical protein
MTSTFTTTSTFTRTHAKHLAAKVIADLYQCSMLYDRPGEAAIEHYETELIELLANEYVLRYEFGFAIDGKRLLSWEYTVGPDGGLHADSDAGGIYSKGKVAQATYFNFLTPSNKWDKLSAAQQAAFRSTLPFQRTPGSGPIDGDGYWQVDHGYGAGGVRVERRTFRPL